METETIEFYGKSGTSASALQQARLFDQQGKEVASSEVEEPDGYHRVYKFEIDPKEPYLVTIVDVPASGKGIIRATKTVGNGQLSGDQKEIEKNFLSKKNKQTTPYPYRP